MTGKTFIYAVHALDHDRAVRKAEEGVMPNFRRLMEKGSHGVTRSVFSTASPVDYTSMLTGTTHTTHGVDDFQTGTRKGFRFSRNPGEKEVIHPADADDTRLYTSYDVDVPWVWQMMEDEKAMQFGIFSPTTYPAPELPNDGVWVSGYWSKPTNFLKDQEAACNDQDIRQELLEYYPDYSVTPLFALPPLYPEGCESQEDYLREFLEQSKEVSRRLQDARLEVMKDYDWDVFLTEEALCDNVQHLLWPRTSDSQDGTDRWLENEGLLDEYYRHIDKVLGKFLETLPDGTNIVIISCHGHQDSGEDYYMHDRFLNLYKYGIWSQPDGWELREERPDWSPPTRAEHNYEGIYITSGPDFASEGKASPMSCMDFTPLMLELYGYGKPKHLDGKTPKHLLE